MNEPAPASPPHDADVGRDPNTGKFMPQKFRGLDTGLQLALHRAGELWALSNGLEQRARQAAALVATTCLLPFLVASNFPAAGALRFWQGLMLVATSGCSLAVVYKAISQCATMAWRGVPSVPATLKLMSEVHTSPQVAVSMLLSLGKMDIERQDACEAQARDADKLVRAAKVALGVQAATAQIIFLLARI